MAPNPRKRVAGDGSSYSSRSKTPKLSVPDHITSPTDPPDGTQSVSGAIAPQVHSHLRGRYHTLARRPVEPKLRWMPNNQVTSYGSSMHLPAHHQRQAYCAVPPSRPSNTPTPVVHKPAVLHQQHPDSKLCRDFHWVPYPLGLMPHDSWYRLHHGSAKTPPLPFRCPVCGQERKATGHMRKVFLVAERLSWDEKLISGPDRDLNEELNWTVNYELGILDPFVEDPEQIPGGKNSRENKFYPYQNEYEMKLAFKLIFMTEDITSVTWSLWIGVQSDFQDLLSSDEDMALSSEPEQANVAQVKQEVMPPLRRIRHTTPDPIETIDLTGSPEPPSKLARGKSYGLPTPPSSLPRMASKIHHADDVVPDNGQYIPTSSSNIRPAPASEPSRRSVPLKRIESYKTLQDFYSLLDKIERSSYVGALFLEAYAEKLRDDMCRSCWLKHNVNLDLF